MITEKFIDNLVDAFVGNDAEFLILSEFRDDITDAIGDGDNEIYYNCYPNLLNPNRTDIPSKDEVILENVIIKYLKKNGFNAYHDGQCFVLDWKNI